MASSFNAPLGDAIVTGGSGAIGSRLVRRLLTDGASTVTVIDDLSSGYEWLLPTDARLKLLRRDVVDILDLEVPGGAPVVFHLAAFFANQNSVDHPADDLHTNGLGTLNVLQWASQHGARRVVYASAGCSIAGHGIDAPIRENMPVSLYLDTPYQITKALGEFYCNYFLPQTSSVRCRFFNSYGPGEVPGPYRNVIPNFIWRALHDIPLVITGTGEETRDFIYVDDLVEGLVRGAMTPAAHGEAINLGTGIQTRVIDLAREIIVLCNSNSEIQFAPRRGWDHSTRRQADNSKAKDLLGLSPSVALHEGLEQTVAWFNEHRDRLEEILTPSGELLHRIAGDAMKILVTGGAGFIGSHIVDALSVRGDEVICIDSLDPGVHHGPPAYLRNDVDYCFTDLRYWRPDDRFDDVEAVVHLAALGGVSRAAREMENVIGANCGGTAKLAETASRWTKLKAVVLASSFSIYGSGYLYRCASCGAERTGARDSADLARGEFEVRCAHCGGETEITPITTSASPAPLETYGASKYMQELCFRGFERAPVHIMRFSSAYGTRLRLDDGEATIIAKLAGWIRAGKSPSLFEDGRQIRDWVYVGDIVDATLALIDTAGPASVVNVCSGGPTTLREACDILSEVIGRDDAAARVVGDYRPGDMRHCLGDAGPLAELLGRPPVQFRDGARLAFGNASHASAPA